MQKNWKQIEQIYGQHDSHLIYFVEVMNNIIQLINYLFILFRMSQHYLLIENEVKKFG
jgi:hypothetical protein